MKILNLVLGLIATFLAAFVLQYGFNHLALDFINYRRLFYFESFILVELLSFVMFIGTPKDFNRDQEDEDQARQTLYNTAYKIVGYVVFLVIFVILSVIK